MAAVMLTAAHAENIAAAPAPIDIEARGHRIVRVPDHVVAAGDPTLEPLLAEIGATRAW